MAAVAAVAILRPVSHMHSSTAGGRRPRALLAPSAPDRGVPGHPVLSGCGDLIDDHGIGGHEPCRDDLRLLYFVSLEPDTGRLDHARLVPLQIHRMRLRHASATDAEWLHEVLARTSRTFGTCIALGPKGTLTVHAPQRGALGRTHRDPVTS